MHFLPFKSGKPLFCSYGHGSGQKRPPLLDYVGRSAILAQTELNTVCVRVWAFVKGKRCTCTEIHKNTYSFKYIKYTEDISRNQHIPKASTNTHCDVKYPPYFEEIISK